MLPHFLHALLVYKNQWWIQGAYLAPAPLLIHPLWY